MFACFDMKCQYVLCFSLMTCMLLFSSISESYGHGLGYEIMPPEMLGSKLVSLEISSDTWPDEYTKEISVKNLVEIINEQDPTYSPLSLYFIIDNKLISNQSEINSYFDTLIEKVSLDKEIKNLVIYKKALFNADQAQESDLLNTLNPLINSKSVWKSHALYLMAEYFYSKDQKQKSKEFFNQIISLEISNSDIRLQAEKRLNRDLSE